MAFYERPLLTTATQYIFTIETQGHRSFPLPPLSSPPPLPSPLSSPLFSVTLRSFKTFRVAADNPAQRLIEFPANKFSAGTIKIRKLLKNNYDNEGKLGGRSINDSGSALLHPHIKGGVKNARIVMPALIALGWITHCVLILKHPHLLF